MNQPEMCKFLIEEGLDVDHVSFKSWPLHNSKASYVYAIHILTLILTRMQELLAKRHGGAGFNQIQERAHVYKRMS
jgi:hypothetical protein